MTDFRSNAVIAAGANLPFEDFQPQLTLRKSVRALADAGLMIRATSEFYATPCFPEGAGPDYVNAAFLVATNLDPQGLLQLLHDIEHRFGRARAQRWGMRTLDLDIISFDDAVLPDLPGYTEWLTLSADRQAQEAPDRLILPHPRLQDRAFVLVPMADVAPDWRHPVLGKSVREMLAALPEAEVAKIAPVPV